MASGVVSSMTGFAAVQGSLADERTFALTIKSVNHRHLDLQVRLPGGQDALEPALRAAVKAAVRRGHVEVTLTVIKPAPAIGPAAGQAAVSVPVLDEAALAAYVRAFRRAAELVGSTAQPEVGGLLRLPGVMVAAPPVAAAAAEAPVPPTPLDGPVLEAFDRLLADFNAARRAEGTALADELKAAMARLAELAAEAGRLREGAAAREFERLRARIVDLLTAAGVEERIDEARLINEAGVLAARGDVEEELVRLQTHIARFVELLDAGGELGRQLDFLLQELNREANTLLSKTGGSEAGLRLTEIGLAVKVELERAREQVQNLE